MRQPFQHKGLGEKLSAITDPALKDRARLDKARKPASMTDSARCSIFCSP